jgi:hypothetical protein
MNVELGLWPRNSFSGNIFDIGSLQCVCTTFLEWTTPFQAQFFVPLSLELIPSAIE